MNFKFGFTYIYLFMLLTGCATTNWTAKKATEYPTEVSSRYSEEIMVAEIEWNRAGLEWSTYCADKFPDRLVVFFWEDADLVKFYNSLPQHGQDVAGFNAGFVLPWSGWYFLYLKECGDEDCRRVNFVWELLRAFVLCNMGSEFKDYALIPDIVFRGENSVYRKIISRFNPD